MLFYIFGMPYEMKWLLTSAFVSLLFTFIFVKFAISHLPKDQGRAYALNGQLSKGKPRGAGMVFSFTSIFIFVLFVPVRLEYLIYYSLFGLSTLTGFFDDRSHHPWGELKKGLLDLVICLAISITFLCFNSNFSISLFKWTIELPRWLFLLMSTFLLWVSINFTNCTDGVDGLLGTVSVVSITTLGMIFLFFFHENSLFQMCLIFTASLLAYLIFNVAPSQIIMGDAGSRTIGVFLGVMALKTGNVLFFIPSAIVIIFDGGIGLLKLAVIRITKDKRFLANLRTPLHDHFRGKWHWSDTQVCYRFTIVQIISSCILLAFLLS